MAKTRPDLINASYLSDIVFWGLYSLIPAVMLITWTHGRPGKDKEGPQKLLEWLASPSFEAELAKSRSAQIPVRPEITNLPEHIKVPGKDFRAATFDWYAVAKNINVGALTGTPRSAEVENASIVAA